MALTKDDLIAISQLMDERLKPINERFDQIDNRFNKMDTCLAVIEHKEDRTAKTLENLRLDAAVAERDIRRDIHELKDEMETVIEVLKMNDILPT